MHGFNYSVPAISPLKERAPPAVYALSVHAAPAITASPMTVGPCSGPPAPQYAGWLDAADCNTIRGWIADRNRLNISLTVSIYDGATLLASGVPADQFYQGVADYLHDNGMHGFTYAVPANSPLKSGS